MEINTKHFQFYSAAGLWWLRVFGRGVHCKDVNRHPLIYSQRKGGQKSFMISKWRFAFLQCIDLKQEAQKALDGIDCIYPSTP